MKRFLLLTLLITSFSFTSNATWTQTNGPTGGDVNCLLTVGSNVFAGTPNGVFLSTNAGASWAVKNSGLNTGLDHTEVKAMASIGSTVFIGTDEGVFSSANNGASWLDANGGIGTALPNSRYVLSMVVKGTDVFVGLNSGGVYKSSNNGSVWTSVNTGFPINKPVISIVVMGTNLFAATYVGGIYSSSNNGTSWAAVPDASVATSPLTAMVASGTTLFAAEAGTSGVLVSTNNGTSFSVSSNGLPFGLDVSSFAVSGSTIYAGSLHDGIFKTTNNGSSWTASTTGLISSQICGIKAFTFIGSDVLAGSEGCGIYKSTNAGTSWAESNNALYNTTVHTIAYSGTTLFAGIDGVGIFKSTDDGTTWTNSSVGTSIYNIWALKAFGPAIIAGGDGGAYKSLNNGQSWTTITNGFDIFTAVYGFAADASNLYAGTSDGVYISANVGASWTLSNSGLGFSTTIHDITSSGSTIYVGTDDGLYKSTNAGGTWSLVYSSLLGVSKIAVNGTFIYILPVYGTAPLLSTNGGLAFNPISGGLPSFLNSVNSLATVSTNVYLGTADGVYRSSNGATTWTNFSTGFPPSTLVNSLATNSSTIFAGTDYGVWKNTLELSTQICIVGVDSLSEHNVIVWEKAPVTTIDSFRIYREDISNIFTCIAKVAFHQLSQYTDTSNTANPNFVNRKYKIQDVSIDTNSFGVITKTLSPMSAWHNTILLTNIDSNFYWNPYWIEGQSLGYPVVQNKLLRDNIGSGVWQVIQTTPGSNGAIVASDYSLYPNARYRIEGDLGGLTCTPTMRTSAGINSTRSNIKNRTIGIREIADFNSRVVLQPNPANDFLIVKYSVAVETIRVVDYLGRELILQQTENPKSDGSTLLNIANFKGGIYTIICKGKDFEVRKKLVVE